MEAHEWMIKYTRQTEWIDRRGILLWLALYTGGLGGGLYLVSLYFNSFWGMLIGWLIVAVLKGSFHLAFLGKPWRFWRIMTKPQSSWLARGFIFVVSFVGLAAIQILLSIWLPGTTLEFILKILAGAMAFGVAIYTGFVLNNVKSIPFWNSPLLPLLFIMCSILGGFGLIIVIALFGGNVDIAAAETLSRWLLLINSLLIAIYLWNSSQSGATGKQSVLEQMRGNAAPVFWIGVVILGIIIPIAIAFSLHFINKASTALLLVGVLCEIIGGLALRYCILKVGIYQPLLPLPLFADKQFKR